MSRYGSAVYGLDLYGPDNLNSYDFVSDLTLMSGAFLMAQDDGHNTVSVTWTLPTGAWDRMRLVRSRSGIPVDESDEVVLSESLSSSPVLAYQDSGLEGSTYYYYAVFLRTKRVDGTLAWVRAGAGKGLSVGDQGSGKTLLDRLPRIFTSPYSATGRADETAPLARFLDLVGFNIDAYKDRISNLLYVNDANRVPGDLLPPLLGQFGYSYTPDIGMGQNRVLARNAVLLSQIKGTAPGAAGLASAVTGWGAETLPVANLLLTADDASMQTSIGSWVATSTNTVIARAVTPSIDTTGSLRLTRTGSTGDIVVELLGSDPLTQAVPLAGGQSYLFTVGVLGSATVTLGGTVHGDPGATVTISSTTFASDPINSAWTRYTATLTVPEGGGIVFAPKVTFSSVATTTTLYMDEIAIGPQGRLNLGGTVTTLIDGGSSGGGYGTGSYGSGSYGAGGAGSVYTNSYAVRYLPPRDVRVLLHADRINEALGGGFDLVVCPGTSFHCSVARTTTDTYDNGAGAGIVTATASTFTWAPQLAVDANRPYTLSLQVKPTAGQTNTLTLSAEAFIDGTGASVGTMMSGPSQPLVAGVWQRVSFTFTTPMNALQGEFKLSFTGASGDTIRLDDILVERGTEVLDYFDYRNQPKNVLWEGTVGLSRLHFYRARPARQTALSNMLRDYLPLGSTFTLLMAQPRF